MNSQNKITVPQEVVELAKVFKTEGATLYIVGGFVRDSLMGKKPYDIDICCNLPTQKVKEILKPTPFKYKTKNSSFGTATISVNEFNFEYTCFRTEIYENNGSHTPKNITFVSDIKTDASRRDFYVNALYYDILNQKVVDPLGKGLDNLKNNILQVINHEVCAFCEDATRILRLVKFSALLNFDIEPNTLSLAKKYSYLLENITPARYKKELGFITNLNQETKNKVNKLFSQITPSYEEIIHFAN